MEHCYVISLPNCPNCGEDLIYATLIDEENSPKFEFAKAVSRCPSCDSQILFGHLDLDFVNSPKIDKKDFMTCIVKSSTTYRRENDKWITIK